MPNLSTPGGGGSGFLRAPGYDGMDVDQNPSVTDSFTNDQAIAIQFGYAVARSLADNTCKAPTLDTDPIIGLASRHAIMPTQGYGDGGTNQVQYSQWATVPVKREGRIYKVPAENVTRGDIVVSLTAQNGALGSAANNLLATANAALAGNAKATGTITMTNQPVAGDTVTVNGVVLTFVAAGAVNGQVNLGVDKNHTATNLQAVLSESVNPLLTVADYTVSGAVVTIVGLLGGVADNAFTLATSDAANIAVSGATLASGAANTGNATIAMGGQPTTNLAKNGVYTAVCVTATTAAVYDPNGAYVGLATFGQQFANEVIFTITAGATPCVAGDSFTITVVANAGRVQLDGTKGNCKAVWEQTGGPNGVALAVRIVN
jgi:hypothetical protein